MVLRNQGARTDLGANAPKLTTWADYCEDIGVNKSTECLATGPRAPGAAERLTGSQRAPARRWGSAEHCGVDHTTVMRIRKQLVESTSSTYEEPQPASHDGGPFPWLVRQGGEEEAGAQTGRFCGGNSSTTKRQGSPRAESDQGLQDEVNRSRWQRCHQLQMQSPATRPARRWGSAGRRSTRAPSEKTRSGQQKYFRAY